MTSSMQKVRSEDQFGETLDRCISDGILKFGGGLGIGILFSVIIFRRKAWPVIFGSGTGLGMALSNFQHELQAPYAIHDKKKTSEAAVETPSDQIIALQKQ